MKRVLMLFMIYGLGLPVLAQNNAFKDRTNHIISVGATNSVINNKYDHINDYAGFSNRQISVGLEIGYLFSYQVLRKLELKTGAGISFVRDAFKYYSSTTIASSGLPTLPFLIEYKPFTKSQLFISGGVKFSIDPYDATFFKYYPADPNSDLYPEKSITTVHMAGVNPIVSLGIGGSKLINAKYRIEWLLSYNQGTTSLRNFTFIRYTPYVKSEVKSYGSHLKFSLRYYFKKYSHNE